MVDEGTEGFQILSDFSHPQNLSLIVQSSADCLTMENKIMMHKIMQKFIRLDSPYEVLEEAVQIASKKTRSKVGSIVNAKCSLELQESSFLCLLCNNVSLLLESTYAVHVMKRFTGMGVLSEIINTLKMIYSEEFPNMRLRRVLRSALSKALIRINEGSYEELDTLMSLLPEFALPYVGQGRSCITKTGKVMTVIEEAEKLRDNMDIKGLYYDSVQPDVQTALTEPIENLTGSIDVDEMSEEMILKASIVFSDPIICRQFLDAAFQIDESPMMSQVEIDHIKRLQVFFLRGLLTMLKKKN